VASSSNHSSVLLFNNHQVSPQILVAQCCRQALRHRVPQRFPHERDRIFSPHHNDEDKKQRIAGLLKFTIYPTSILRCFPTVSCAMPSTSDSRLFPENHPIPRGRCATLATNPNFHPASRPSYSLWPLFEESPDSQSRQHRRFTGGWIRDFEGMRQAGDGVSWSGNKVAESLRLGVGTLPQPSLNLHL